MALIETSVGWAKVFILEEPGSRSSLKKKIGDPSGWGFKEYYQKLKLVHFGFRSNFSDYQFLRPTILDFTMLFGSRFKGRLILDPCVTWLHLWVVGWFWTLEFKKKTHWDSNFFGLHYWIELFRKFDLENMCMFPWSLSLADYLFYPHSISQGVYVKSWNTSITIVTDFALLWWLLPPNPQTNIVQEQLPINIPPIFGIKWKLHYCLMALPQWQLQTKTVKIRNVPWNSPKTTREKSAKLNPQ